MTMRQVSTSAERPQSVGSLQETGSTRLWLAVGALLVVFLLFCVDGLRRDSVTVDEFAHLPAGYHYLQSGRFELFPHNPPLVKVLCALPLLALRPQVDREAPVRAEGWYPWVYGTDFMQRNRDDYRRLFLWGRLPVVAMGAALCLLVFFWARRLYGDEAGLAALLLMACSPTLVAHSHLATVDVGGALFATLALFCWQRFAERPSGARLAAAGVTLGLAQLAKLTALLLYPLLLLLTVVAVWRGARLAPWGGVPEGGAEGRSGGRRPDFRRRLASSLGAFALVGVVSLAVLDLGYLFQGVGAPLGGQALHSRRLQAVAGLLPPGTPLPVPTAWLAGVDALATIGEVGEYPEYLFGRFSTTGTRVYYLVALLFKSPLPWLAALALAPFVRPARRLPGERTLWLSGLLVVAAFSLTGGAHYGIRYLLPALPLLTVWSARIVPWLRQRAAGSRTVAAVALVGLLAIPGSALFALPDSIGYFNLLAGGRGERILLDSNLDWGQGLGRVRRYMDREGLEQIDLAYFGHVDPALYGIPWRFPRRNRPGLAAVSLNFVHGYPYATFAKGRIVQVPADAFSWVQQYPRVADLGGGIAVFRIDGRPPAAP